MALKSHSYINEIIFLILHRQLGPNISQSPTGPPPPKQWRIELSQSTDAAEFSQGIITTDHEKYQFIVNHFSPDQPYQFPRTPSGRTFQHQWLVKYPWLKYSKQENGGFCLLCVIFSRNRTSRADPGVLVSSPLINFKRALETLEKHTGKVYHKEAIATMDNFLKVILSDTGKQLVVTNRRKIQSIVETVILCGLQNIPLRGHRDSGVDVESDTSAAKNHGNFWAQLQFRV